MIKVRTKYSSEVGEVILKTLADPDISKSGGLYDPQRTIDLFMKHLTVENMNIVNNKGQAQTCLAVLVDARSTLEHAAKMIRNLLIKREGQSTFHPIQPRIGEVVAEINRLLGVL